MRIGSLARASGVSQRMLRYYEEQGLLAPARRESGYREYAERDLQTVTHIRALSAAGLTLDSIRGLLPCATGERLQLEPCPELLASLTGELADLDQRLDHLRYSRQLLADYLNATRAHDRPGRSVR